MSRLPSPHKGNRAPGPAPARLPAAHQLSRRRDSPTPSNLPRSSCPPSTGQAYPNLWLIRVHFKGGDKGFLRDFNLAELAHLLLALLLLVEELALARDVAAIAFGRHVLAQRLDRFARNHFAADGSLHRNLEQVPRDEVLQLLAHAAPARLGASA